MESFLLELAEVDADRGLPSRRTNAGAPDYVKLDAIARFRDSLREDGEERGTGRYRRQRGDDERDDDRQSSSIAQLL